MCIYICKKASGLYIYIYITASILPFSMMVSWRSSPICLGSGLKPYCHRGTSTRFNPHPWHESWLIGSKMACYTSLWHGLFFTPGKLTSPRSSVEIKLVGLWMRKNCMWKSWYAHRIGNYAWKGVKSNMVYHLDILGSLWYHNISLYTHKVKYT